MSPPAKKNYGASLDDYVDVAERIQDFKDAHPNGSLQTLGWEIVTVEGYDRKASAPVKTTFIVYRAAAFRSEDDDAPGHGIAWEPFPGATPYTKDSELMNAETAAWGRAIVALGLVANRSLASRQEVRNRRADQEAEAEHASKPKATPAKPPEPVEVDGSKPVHEQPTTIDESVLAHLRATCNEVKVDANTLAWFLVSVGVEALPSNPSKDDIGAAMRGLTLEQAFKLEALLKGEDESVAGSGEAA